MHENLGAGHVSTNKELWFLGVKLTWEKDQYLFLFYAFLEHDSGNDVYNDHDDDRPLEGMARPR